MLAQEPAKLGTTGMVPCLPEFKPPQPHVADDDESVLGPGEDYVEAPGFTDEPNAFGVLGVGGGEIEDGDVGSKP